MNREQAIQLCTAIGVDPTVACGDKDRADAVADAINGKPQEKPEAQKGERK